MRIYFATDIHGSEVCWRKFLNAARFYQADTLILGGDVSGKAVVPVVARPGDGFLIRQFHGERVLTADETAQVETRIRDMGFYPYRTTDEELEEIWDDPEAVHAVFLTVMRETLTRWLDLAEQRLAGSGIPVPASRCSARSSNRVSVSRISSRKTACTASGLSQISSSSSSVVRYG
jgi:Icc-related predicted phosphoesterase